MDDCLFCLIAEKKIPTTVVYDDPICLAFRDIHPQAPTHILVIPKRHIASLNDFTAKEAELAGQLIWNATRIARTEGIADDGYRLVWNCGEKAGQSVFHIHLHILGGRAFAWPPG